MYSENVHGSVISSSFKKHHSTDTAKIRTTVKPACNGISGDMTLFRFRTSLRLIQVLFGKINIAQCIPHTFVAY